MPSFKAAYLIHGDDHGRIAERRSRLRAMAEAETGSAGVEVLEAEASTPEAVAAALSAMTFAMGRRFVIADGVERWKDSQVEPVIEALATVDPETLTVAFFAREDAKLKLPAGLAKAVEKAGGQIAEESQVKPRALPGWVVKQGSDLGLNVDNSAARALIALVGDRQQRLLRELEKLALEYGRGAGIGVEEVRESCASSAERTVFALADAVVAGDQKAAIRHLLELREQGERLPSLLYRLVRGLRDALAVMEAHEAGQPSASIKKSVRVQPWKVDKLIGHAGRRDAEAYRRALVRLADLEVESRGGIGMVAGGLEEDTAAVRALIAAAS